MIHYCNRIINYSFYALFALVPLAFTDKTYELFEFNKMWLTFGITIVIIAAWCIKMVAQKEIRIQRTPLDIPIMLFLASQTIATIFSLDTHVSLWGYYSRFNGGLLSIFTYTLLYYAFVSNLGTLRYVKRILKISLISGLIVALWGLPSHFGYDPTCLLFRGTLDASCWTQDFQPKVRIFSTFGQPNWLAAYFAVLIPITIAFAIQSKNRLSSIFYLLSSVLFYFDLLFTRSQSGFIGVWIAILFLGIILAIQKKYLYVLVVFACIGSITFFVGSPINLLKQFTLPGLLEKRTEQASTKNGEALKEERFAGELGGTDSKKIRLIVWRGAIDAWRAKPISGWGVENFAFAYYRFRPKAHNLTSEWDFLYNKAHNEYLNYLATTGILGFGSYMLMIGTFLLIARKQISKSKFLISKQIPNPKSQLGQLEIRSMRNLELALLASYISILVSNFFGFSVVMIQIFFFLTPAFVFVLSGLLKPHHSLVLFGESGIMNHESGKRNFGIAQWIFVVSIILTSLFLILTLLRFWIADTAYALGSSLNKTQEYKSAYLKLHEAVHFRSNEPHFQDELASNDAILSVGLHETSASDAALLRDEAIRVSDSLVRRHPNNVVFWKTRVRIFYMLGQIDETYLPRALDAAKKASTLAPTDAKISYNVGLLYGQTGNLAKAIETLERTTMLKPNYRDAYYALGLFYKEIKEDEKAASSMRYILTAIDPSDEQAKQALKTWGVL